MSYTFCIWNIYALGQDLSMHVKILNPCDLDLDLRVCV